MTAPRALQPRLDGSAAGCIPRRAPDAPIPLSFAQERLWFFHRLQPGSPLYSAQATFRIDGPVRPRLLEACLARIVGRHDVLRTAFVQEGDEPHQRVAARGSVTARLFTIDLSSLQPDRQDEALARATAQLADWPFDLAAPPLARLALFSLTADRHALLAVVHHMIADGWSLFVFVRELAATYERIARGITDDTPELPIQFGDFAIWQRDRLHGDELARLRAFWRQAGAGLPDARAPHEPRPRGGAAPSSRPREACGEVVRIQIDGATVDRLHARARQSRTTLFVAWLTAACAALSASTAQTELIVSTDVAWRETPELEPLIGLLVEQLPVRVTLKPDERLRHLLGRMKMAFLAAYAHRDLPFDEALRAMAGGRPGAARLESALHVVLLPPVPAPLRAHDVVFSLLPTERWRARFERTLFLEARPDGVAAWLVFDPTRVETTAAQRLLDNLTAIARALAGEDDCTLADALPRRASDASTERSMESATRAARDLQRLKAMKAQPIASGDAVRRRPLRDGQALPLVFEPAVPDVDLVAWATQHRSELLGALTRHGALLFRGFGIDGPVRFERLTRVICTDLLEENGEHNREGVAGSVFTPTFFPPERKVLWHHENAFNFRWPRLILFCCLTPAASGGETPIVDGRAVFDAIDPRWRQLFIERGVTYVRNYGAGLGLDWRTVFQTDDRGRVEQICHENGMTFQWKPDDRLMTRARRPAAIRHPETGDTVWFNQAPHWHTFFLGQEARETLAQAFAEDDLPRSFCFGDGSAIPDEAMADVHRAYEALEVAFPWQAGDVMLVDNVLTAHARNPFGGARSLLVTMGNVVSYADIEVARA